ncbi:hypothetical protein M885DRAFT_617882 [Pelagophyceae sp. CCMP2097]|nr:hypothetical protein M885DRAFT_617882 [Pelagophyceae sp. CCMP2097]
MFPWGSPPSFLRGSAPSPAAAYARLAPGGSAPRPALTEYLVYECVDAAGHAVRVEETFETPHSACLALKLREEAGAFVGFVAVRDGQSLQQLFASSTSDDAARRARRHGFDDVHVYVGDCCRAHGIRVGAAVALRLLDDPVEGALEPALDYVVFRCGRLRAVPVGEYATNAAAARALAAGNVARCLERELCDEDFVEDGDEADVGFIAQRLGRGLLVLIESEDPDQPAEVRETVLRCARTRDIQIPGTYLPPDPT